MHKVPELIISQREVIKGRGSISNRGSRYQSLQSFWEDGIEGPSRFTECRPVTARSVISRNNSPDVPFQLSINPYQGCEHGCTYCYARPTHAYHDLSPGLDFETRLSFKQNAAQQLRRELARPAYQCQCITIGANTDAYQPVEKVHGITRQLLQVLQECRHPVAIITKGALVTRDIDILAEMAADGLSSVAMSITTLDKELKRHMEPRAASARARIKATEELARAGIPVTLLFSPVIPGLNDMDMEEIVRLAAEAGAESAACMLLRLPLEISDLFQEWLHQYYPLKAGRVMSLLRQCRGGRENDSRFGHRMRGQGPVAELISRRFKLACKKQGLAEGERYGGRTDLFRPPGWEGANREQFDLFS